MSGAKSVRGADRRVVVPAGIVLGFAGILALGLNTVRPAGAAVAAMDAGALRADAGVATAISGVDAGAGVAAAADAGMAPVAVPAIAPAADPGEAPRRQRMETLTVLGTRESRTAGSAHVLRGKDLERLDQDNPEAVVKSVPGVYTRGEDGVGLRPNVGIRGTNPDRSKKLTLMEDGILFGPAPYSAPAAYYFPLITRMEAVRVIKGPGAVSFGPNTVGGAIDLVTRAIPLATGSAGAGGLDVAAGQYGYGKVHGHYGMGDERSGFVLEGVHARSDGFKDLDGGGDTGYARNEWMWKGRHRLTDDPVSVHELRLKVGYSDEDSDETYLGLTDADFRDQPLRRYRASRLDHMEWHRTQIVGAYHGEWRRDLTWDVSLYRHDLARTWRKVNRFGGASLSSVLANPSSARNQVYYRVLTGAADSSGPDDTIFIGPNRRSFVSQGVQAMLAWRGATGPVAHRLELGARVHYDRIERLHTEEGFLMRSGVLVPAGGTPIVSADGRAWTHATAVHAADAATLGPLTLTPGVRVEVIKAHLLDRKDGRAVAGERRATLIPGVGAYAALSPWLGVLAGAYRGFSPAAPGQPAAVEPETSINYEAGARARVAGVRFEAIGFFNDYRNLTSLCGVSTCDSERADRQYDAGRAHIFGAEAFVHGEPTLGRGFSLPLLAAYTYTRTELLEAFESDDPSLGLVAAGDELPYVPRHQGSGTVGLVHERGALAAALTYVSPAREKAGQGEMKAEVRTDQQTIVDVTARWRLLRGRGEIYLHLRNALGADDLIGRRPFGARPVAPRWIQLGTRWRL